MIYQADSEIPHSDLNKILVAREGWDLLHVLELKVPGSVALPMITLIWGKPSGAGIPVGAGDLLSQKAEDSSDSITVEGANAKEELLKWVEGHK